MAQVLPAVGQSAAAVTGNRDDQQQPAAAAGENSGASSSAAGAAVAVVAPPAGSSTSAGIGQQQPLRFVSKCPRLDLFEDELQPGLAQNRTRVLNLPAHESFNHMFEVLRFTDAKHHHLKSQPIAPIPGTLTTSSSSAETLASGADSGSATKHLNLIQILQSPEGNSTAEARAAINGEEIQRLAERVARSSEIPKSLSKQNAILTPKKEAEFKQRLEEQQRLLQAQRKKKKPIGPLAANISSAEAAASGSAAALRTTAATSRPASSVASSAARGGRGRGRGRQQSANNSAVRRY